MYTTVSSPKCRNLSRYTIDVLVSTMSYPLRLLLLRCLKITERWTSKFRFLSNIKPLGSELGDTNKLSTISSPDCTNLTTYTSQVLFTPTYS